ncbi:MAG TPA: helix-turn-helix domain-containing protein [Trebonia sp.]|nr:helix-turn-helix domain-containing protein [Trebonia sp.]
MSIGESLAESRREAGLTVSQVSQQTRIRESIIRSIEQGDFSSCGGDFYARGHVRSIAGVIGTDPAPLIREYDEEHGPPGAISAADVFEPSTPIKIRDPKPFPFGKVLAVVVVAAAGFGVYRFATGGPAKPAAHPVSINKPSATAVASPKPTPKPAPKPPAYPPGQAKIVLKATTDCWIQLTGDNGKSLFQGVVSAGTTKTWLEKQSVALQLGNPSGIRLTVNGKNETPNTVSPMTVHVNPADHAHLVDTGGIPIKSA